MRKATVIPRFAAFAPFVFSLFISVVISCILTADALFPADAMAQDSQTVPAAQAEATSVPPVLYFILDSSRSMWGRIDDKPKVEIAKEQMTQLIRQMPENVQFGITTFGHRKSSDCADIEELYAAGANDREEAIKKITALNPIGKSPVSDSIEFALDRLKDYNGPKTVVLISDGIEACYKDPCEAAKRLKQSGINFTIEVIGFNLREDEVKELNCVAEASGGTFRKITEAAALFSTLKEVEKIALDKPKFVLPVVTLAAPVVSKKVPPAPGAKTGRTGNGHIIIEHDPWLLKPFYWKLIDAETGENVAQYSSFEETRVPNGTFMLAWRQYQHGSTEIILKDSVTVKDGEEVVIPLRTAIRLNVPTWAKPPRYWGLQDPDSKEQIVTFTTFEPFLVPAGEYELIWRQYENRSDTMSFGRIDIDTDRVNYFTLNTAVSLQPASWIPEKVFYWGLKNPETSEWVARFYGDFSQQIAPPGKYIVVYRQSEEDSTDSEIGIIDLEENEETRMVVNTGIRLVTRNTSLTPEFVEFAELDQNNQIGRVVKLTKTLSPMPLKPGKYRVSYVPAGRTLDVPVIAADELEIKGGELAEIDLDDLLHTVTIVKATG